MRKLIRTTRRTWIAAWVVLCTGGIAATAGLNAASAPDPHPEEPVSAECAEYIADIEKQLAKAKREGTDDGVLAFSRSKVGADDCSNEIHEHFGGDR
jgi:1-aminocyclopropane-1-carboxylate deaminase/D-cysteine desulfhydrase-like pyridoxal-dependent ACC family enzyme